MGTHALIGLGSNLGDREAILDSAIASLSATPGIDVLAVSSYLETEPVGGPDGQGSYFNAAVSVATTLAPGSLHDHLRRIERGAGRVRLVRWGERVLDLDILLFGLTILDSPNLTIPHPRMAVRRFVVAPSAEIAPNMIEPRTRLSLSALLANLDRRPSVLALDGPERHVKSLFRPLVERLDAIAISILPERHTISPNFGTTLQPHDVSESEGLKIMEGTIERLRIESSTQAIDRGRWIVTDGYFDLLDLIPSRSSDSHPPAWLAEFRSILGEAISGVIRPTFRATVGSKGDIDNNALDRRAGCEGDFGDVPILRISNSGLDAGLEEILAACVASRSGCDPS